uniref:MADS-box domain-containing protein n=1 Tax=Oryza punctata TaxID=4537 RepID=A0A0E0L0N0_ORYPU
MLKGKARAGRKKIEIKRIEKKNAREVCFSKRRRTLFNKAGELSLLCNANIAAVVISPAGRGFSFAHPSVDDVADRLASMAMGTPNNHSVGGGCHDSGEVTNIGQQQKIEYVELQKTLEKLEKKKRVQEAMKKERAGHLMQLLNSEVNLLGQDELEELHNKLSDLASSTRYSQMQRVLVCHCHSHISK